MAARMTIPVGLSATFTVTKKGNGAPLIVAANRRLINTQWHEGSPYSCARPGCPAGCDRKKQPFKYVEVFARGKR